MAVQKSFSYHIFRYFLVAGIIIGVSVATVYLASPASRQPVHLPGSNKQAPRIAPVTISAVGDIMLSRGVGMMIRRHGTGYPFKYSSALLPDDDITFSNLESPISDRGVRSNKAFVFRAHPKTLEGLKNAGFDVVSLSNNHALDWGRPALADTMNRLDKAGIAFAGAGKDAVSARAPTIVRVKDTRVAFLAYCDLFPLTYYSKKGRVSIAPADPHTLPEDVAEAGRQADIVVVSFHWGNEYQVRSTERQQMLARLAVDSGADLVLGHHPHVLQKVETYRNRVIAYSLGNFIFDQRDSSTKESTVLRIDVAPGRSAVRDVIPISIVKYQPRPADSLVTARVLRRLSIADPSSSSDMARNTQPEAADSIQSPP